jgi:glycosyltransferase involved in cell wall biosynthesis
MGVLSICVLIYKSEGTIERCINSLVSQTSHDFEVVLINNASPDNSISIAKDILTKSRDIKYKIVNIPNNTGCGQGRTLGYQSASNDYIKNLDSDDALFPTFVSTITNVVIREHPDVITYGHKVYDESGKLVRIFSSYRTTECCKYSLTMFWRYTFRKAIALQAKISTIGLHYAEDRIFSLQYMPLIQKASIINEPLYIYYQSKKSITKTINQDAFYKSNAQVFEYYANFYSSLKLKVSKKCLYYFISKFYVSISASNCKGEKEKIGIYFKKYRLLFNHCVKKKRLFIIPTHEFSKETFIVQVSYLFLLFHFYKLFKFIYKRFY